MPEKIVRHDQYESKWKKDEKGSTRLLLGITRIHKDLQLQLQSFLIAIRSVHKKSFVGLCAPQRYPLNNIQSWSMNLANFLFFSLHWFYFLRSFCLRCAPQFMWLFSLTTSTKKGLASNTKRKGHKESEGMNSSYTWTIDVRIKIIQMKPKYSDLVYLNA